MRGQQVEQSSRFSHSIGSVSHSQHAGGEVGEGIILQSGHVGGLVNGIVGIGASLEVYFHMYLIIFDGIGGVLSVPC